VPERRAAVSSVGITYGHHPPRLPAAPPRMPAILRDALHLCQLYDVSYAVDLDAARDRLAAPGDCVRPVISAPSPTPTTCAPPIPRAAAMLGAEAPPCSPVNS